MQWEDWNSINLAELPETDHPEKFSCYNGAVYHVVRSELIAATGGSTHHHYHHPIHHLPSL